MQEFKKEQSQLYKKLKLVAIENHIRALEARIEKYNMADKLQAEKAKRDGVCIQALYDELERRKPKAKEE
jgi:hypothetical protein